MGAGSFEWYQTEVTVLLGLRRLDLLPLRFDEKGGLKTETEFIDNLWQKSILYRVLAVLAKPLDVTPS
jgi:hypothetical protein